MTIEEFYGNSLNADGCFRLSEHVADNFIFSADVKFHSDSGSGALVFRSATADSISDCYTLAVNIDHKKCRFSRWTKGKEEPLSGEMEVPSGNDKIYTLKVIALHNWFSCYVNDVLIASSGDYVLAPLELGQNTVPKEGYFGFLGRGGEVAFFNADCTPIDASNDPTLLDITVSSDVGPIESKGQFNRNTPVTIQYVGNAANDVNITAHPLNPAAEITVTGSDGIVYKDGKGIPVEVGKNIITVESKVKGGACPHTSLIDSKMKGGDWHHTSLLYRVNVHRRQNDAIYYNEPFRDQYHYSVKDGWGNDPNGLVYYKGTYHMFYQFFDGQAWGPMHWGHAGSKDLLHWEERQIAFYPDSNGTMFSGCIVADEKNTSRLFKSPEGGLVAFITCNGNGQRIKLAWSEDEGQTWQKRDEIIADWTEDPLQVMDFRDPKVFRWENRWFMVVAGGPIRIYSSENLLDWTCESTWSEMHSECPDIYPIQAEDGRIRWVFSRAGRFYKIGDFTDESGSWKFVPDEIYDNTDGIMNFGKDSYAAMTFYVQDFGTAENPTLPEILALNWMNTWNNYCNKVAVTVGQAFNGTYNLLLKQALIKDGDKYVLTQTPVDAYKFLREEAAIELKGAEITEQNSLLDSFRGDCYEIVSTFYPGRDTTKVGFKLRSGNAEFTDIFYDCKEQKIAIDRSHSGIIISGYFRYIDSQKCTPNPDGSITMHIYADRESIEVFSKGYTVCGANQIFPSVDSLGASVYAEGEKALVDVSIFPMRSIWEKEVSDEPVAMQAASVEETLIYVEDSTVLRAVLLPVRAEQKIEWSVADESIVRLSENAGTRVTVTGLKHGETVVTARSVENSAFSASYVVKVYENNFETNAGEFQAIAGNWIVDDTILHVSNVGANDFYMASKPVDKAEYTMETKVKFSKGIVNIFFAAKSMYPFVENAYGVQFADNWPNVKVFRFGGDTICETNIGKALNDGQYHAIKIQKSTDTVTVSIDGTVVIETKPEQIVEFFNKDPHIGIGIFNGTMEVQTLNVT